MKPAGDGWDYIGFFVATAGPGARRKATQWQKEGRYLDAHVIASLAIETAEAAAEYVHRKMREQWGFSDPPSFTKENLIRTEYRGIRISFGYPACPDIEDQEKLFALLQPEKDTGVSLTEGYMMDPEASVSALMFHHPEAGYFNPKK